MPAAERENRIEKLLLEKIRSSIGDAPFHIAFRDEGLPEMNGAQAGNVVIRDRKTLARVLLDPEVGFGDGYVNGQIEVHGDLVCFLDEAMRGLRLAGRKSWYNRLLSRWLGFVQDNTRKGSAANIHHHYDLNNDFYKLWLDRDMVYTCGYFPTPEATLEESQTAKLEHVCRKLQLQPGEKVVEAGCGWGALALYMATHYGVSVRAFNISREQIQYARTRARKEGVSDRVEFVEDDYRNISGRFDAFVSIGMLEHVGREHYVELSRVIRSAIGNSGRGLLHFIGKNRPAPFSAWIRKHVFPGAYAPTLREALEICERNAYSVLDVENLRLHYAKTLEHWLERYERSVDRVSAMFGPEFVRMWRLYLAGSLASFRIGHLQLFQVVFAGPACRQIPWTRAHLYAGDADVEGESQWTHARF
jgi:cyclopropane-fatty-acyl-phospholipid synthase